MPLLGRELKDLGRIVADFVTHDIAGMTAAIGDLEHDKQGVVGALKAAGESAKEAADALAGAESAKEGGGAAGAIRSVGEAAKASYPHIRTLADEIERLRIEAADEHLRQLAQFILGGMAGPELSGGGAGPSVGGITAISSGGMMPSNLNGFMQMIRSLPNTFQPATSAMQKFFAALKPGQSDIEQSVRSLGVIKTALQQVKETASSAMESFAGALAHAAMTSLQHEKGVGRALAATTKATLSSLAEQAAAHAIYETAVGVAYLAIQDHNDATLAFESAGIFASVAAVTGGLGAAIHTPRSARVGGGAGAGVGGGVGGPGGSAGWSFNPGAVGAGPGSGPAGVPGGNAHIVVYSSNRELSAFLHAGITAMVQQHGYSLPSPTRPVPVTTGMTR
jgi:hypothetical protein